MIVVPHQLEHIPWLGLIDKFSQADKIVLCDDFQYKEHYFENRNKIRVNSPEGWTYLTVHVESSNHKPMNEVRINNSKNWQRKYLITLQQAYCKTPHFKTYYPSIEKIINSNHIHLMDLNEALLRFILSSFGIHTLIEYSSQYNLPKDAMKSDKVLALMEACGATTFIGGQSAKTYINEASFKEANIEVQYHNFFHPVYTQRYTPFLPNMSALDLLFNYGEMAQDVLTCKGGTSFRYVLNSIPDYPHKKTLEMFGGSGDGFLAWYGWDIKDLDIWELDYKNIEALKAEYTHSRILNTNSITELLTTDEKYDIIILDTPALMNDCILLENVHRLVNNEAYIIQRAIVKSYNNHPQVHVNLFDEDKKILENSGLSVVSCKEYPREYKDGTLWVTHRLWRIEKHV